MICQHLKLTRLFLPILTALLLVSVGQAYAGIDRTRASMATSEQELLEFSAMMQRHSSGFSILSSGRGITGGNIRDYGNPMRGGSTLNQGDFFLMCFRPTVSMYVRVVLIDSDARSYPLHPRGNSAPRVEAGRYYCLGDRKSDLTLPASNPGRYRIWIYGGDDAPPAVNLGGRPSDGAGPSNEYQKSIYFRVK
ncbi:MAG: hypothetical protein MRY59_13995 [Aquisalinus sp.]|nr:hypothetical protein [Aquisalinus sp.]